MDGLNNKQARESGVVDEDTMTPPDDFRQISVFPTMEDLNKDELPFLRKNKRKGGYTSVDHYLDVQFRLLREDFVYPLREGIAEYLASVAAPRRGNRLKVGTILHLLVQSFICWYNPSFVGTIRHLLVQSFICLMIQQIRQS